MNQTIKKRWVEALRSNYKQAKKKLRQGNKFCCLGVLCDLAAQDGIITWQDKDGTYLADGSAVNLPCSVMRWAGLPECGGHNTQIKGCTLSMYNDMGATFAEIADLIAEHL